MQDVLQKGEAVYIRSLSTRRAAIAEVVDPTPLPDRRWVEVQLITDCYAWDDEVAAEAAPQHAGDQVMLASYRIESIRP